MGRIDERIAKQIGVPDLVERLAEDLSGSDLQSLLLEVYRRRAGQRTPGELLADYERNRFTGIGSLDPRDQHRLDQIAFAQLPGAFEVVELSPLAPLGTSSVVTPLDPNLAIATVRNTEVLSDNTNALALEAALRRRDLLRADPRSSERVRLAASHRLVRPQRYANPKLLSHFRMFALVVAGRDTGAQRFEADAVPEVLGVFVALFRDGVGLAADRIRVTLTPLSPGHRVVVEERIAPALAAAHPGTRVELDDDRERGRGYYEGVCFHVYATNDDGAELELGDGGLTPWTARLLSNAKERLLIGGIGIEAVAQAFAPELGC